METDLVTGKLYVKVQGFRKHVCNLRQEKVFLPFSGEHRACLQRQDSYWKISKILHTPGFLINGQKPSEECVQLNENDRITCNLSGSTDSITYMFTYVPTRPSAMQNIYRGAQAAGVMLARAPPQSGTLPPAYSSSGTQQRNLPGVRRPMSIQSWTAKAAALGLERAPAQACASSLLPASSSSGLQQKNLPVLRRPMPIQNRRPHATTVGRAPPNATSSGRVPLASSSSPSWAQQKKLPDDNKNVVKKLAANPKSNTGVITLTWLRQVSVNMGREEMEMIRQLANDLSEIHRILEEMPQNISGIARLSGGTKV